MAMTDYPRCRTCRHWLGQPGQSGGWPCLKVREPADEYDSDAMLAVVMGGRDLWVQPDFGCRQHEERDDGTTREG